MRRHLAKSVVGIQPARPGCRPLDADIRSGFDPTLLKTFDVTAQAWQTVRIEAAPMLAHQPIGRVPGTAEGLAEARSDHDAVAMFLADALATDATDPALSDRVNELRELVVAHASEEEEELFALAETLPPAELARLGREMLARKDDLAGRLTSGATAA